MDDKQLDVYLNSYRWIRVRRHTDQPEQSWEARYRALEAHHERETTFLIAEVRRLAQRLHAAEAQKTDPDTSGQP